MAAIRPLHYGALVSIFERDGYVPIASAAITSSM